MEQLFELPFINLGKVAWFMPLDFLHKTMVLNPCKWTQNKSILCFERDLSFSFLQPPQKLGKTV
jgi:hypothetical protein